MCDEKAYLLNCIWEGVKHFEFLCFSVAIKLYMYVWREGKKSVMMCVFVLYLREGPLV